MHRHTGFELSWTDADCHPHLTTRSFVCCTLTTSGKSLMGREQSFHLSTSELSLCNHCSTTFSLCKMHPIALLSLKFEVLQIV